MKLTQSRLHDLFDYSPETGIMTWKRRPESEFPSVGAAKSWNTKCAGKRAGHLYERKTGYRYRTLTVDGTAIAEHRAIWIYVTGHAPPAQVDHRNRDATDNRWENLRDAEGKNQRNKSMQVNNTSGATGVSRSRQTGKWVAQCYAEGKNHVLGHFTMKYRAIEALQAFRKKHGFCEGHGESLAPYHAQATST